MLACNDTHTHSNDCWRVEEEATQQHQQTNEEKKNQIAMWELE